MEGGGGKATMDERAMGPLTNVNYFSSSIYLGTVDERACTVQSVALATKFLYRKHTPERLEGIKQLSAPIPSSLGATVRAQT
jgi:hypothetical protein